MQFYTRYMDGEYQSVFIDIDQLGNDAFTSEYRPDIEKVLTETFTRVAFNLEMIYKTLLYINYQFKKDFKSNFERPLHAPLPDTETLLAKLDNAVKRFGYVPLSLKYFYAIVGGVNFGWDFRANENIKWPLADPLQIISLDDLVAEWKDQDTLSFYKESYKEDGFIGLELSPDYYHKDNISGGAAYALKITNKPSVDSLFLNEEHHTTFINYLRICFENCGFSRINHPASSNDYQLFFDRVKPLLKPI